MYIAKVNLELYLIDNTCINNTLINSTAVKTAIMLRCLSELLTYKCKGYVEGLVSVKTPRE